MLRADSVQVDQLLTNRVTDAITRHRTLLFVFVGLLYILSFNGRWRLGLDSANYRGLALNIAAGKGYVFGDWAPRQVYPGLPYLLAGIERIFGPADRMAGPVEQQRLLGPSAATSLSVLMIVAAAILTLVFVYKLISLHYSDWIAVTITCGVGTNAVFIQYAHELMTDVPFMLGVVMALYGWELFQRASEPHPRVRALLLLLAGAILAGTMRPMFWVLFVCWVVVCAWSLIATPRKTHAIALAVVLVVCGGLIALMPRGYEREAINWLSSTWRRLPEHTYYILHDQLPAAMFGEQLAPVSVLGSLVVLASTLLLFKRHALWVLIVGCTFIVTVLLSAEPRYYLMVLPTLMLGWLVLFGRIAQRFPGLKGEIILVVALSIVTLNNLSAYTGFLVEQRRPDFLARYKHGDYVPLIEMCGKIREHVRPDQRVLGPAGSIMSVLSGVHVYTQREILPGGADRHTPKRLAEARLDYAIFPHQLYRSKEPIIERAMRRHVIHPGVVIAKVGKMVLAKPIVVVKEGDWWNTPAATGPTTEQDE